MTNLRVWRQIKLWRELERAVKSIRDRPARPAKPAKRFGDNERHNLEKKDQTLHGAEGAALEADEEYVY